MASLYPDLLPRSHRCTQGLGTPRPPFSLRPPRNSSAKDLAFSRERRSSVESCSRYAFGHRNDMLMSRALAQRRIPVEVALLLA
jgi:hypothetical protein